jgi:trigger factor
MPTLVRKDVGNQTAVLTITVSKEDYGKKFDGELKKLKDKASIKGFRKGKTPSSFLKKMYGKSVLGEVVTNILQDELTSYLTKEEVNFLGRPIPSDSHSQVDFIVDSDNDYVFNFDIGLSPEFEVTGASSADIFDYFTIAVADEAVEERLQSLQKRFGVRKETDDLIEQNDLVFIQAAELEGDTVKEQGWKTTFNVLVERMSEEVKAEITTKKRGDVVRFNIYSLEKNTSREYVKKYLLNFTAADLENGLETGEFFEGSIENVTRNEPAPLDEKFFEEVFGPNAISTVQEAKEKIRDFLGQSNKISADGLFFKSFREALLEKNREKITLPDDFLKRWVEFNRESNYEKILENYDKFSEDLRWNLISNKLTKEFNIEVTEEEIRDHAVNMILNYFGGVRETIDIEPIVERLLGNSDQVQKIFTEILNAKLLQAVKERVQLNKIPVSEEELRNRMEEQNAANIAEAVDKINVEEEAVE